jgi:S1-C subfamily serine protease
VPAHAAEIAPAPIDAEAFFSAIVKIETSALPDARSAATLGSDREGTGIVIDRDGLVLTIGYLLIEADEVRIIDDRSRTLPARVVAYDPVSGLGLVRAITPLAATPLRMGDSTSLGVADPVLVVNYRGRSDATQAFVVARRVFTGNWEYMLDSAIFTSPPSLNWSGAALVGTDGALLGIGSLIVRDATEADPHLPGNMFVPVETLKPILADLLKNGHRDGPARPWLGLNADELQGRLVVVRVSPDGPADRAGLQQGDIILGVGGDSVRSQADFYRRLWARGNAGAEIPLRVLQGLDVREIRVRSIDREDYYKRKPTL